MNRVKTILLLEDDKNLNRGISLKLEKEGYHVISAYTLQEAKRFFEKEEVDLIISDITLPDGDGLEFGQYVREKSDVYFIYLTAMDQEIDVVNGYDTGADDYVTKPFSVNILMSKVNAMMRRLQENDTGILISDGIEVSAKEMQVKREGKVITLSKTELQLLIYFLENAGHILSKEKILERIWGLDGQFVDENTIAVNVSRLKNKLGTEQIANVRGLGYVWTGKVNRK